MFLRQGLAQWWPVGTGYRRYRTQWRALTLLERLIVLLAPQDKPLTAEALQHRLSAQHTPVVHDRLEAALDSLVRQQFLSYQDTDYRLAEPGLVRALRQHEGEAGRLQLSHRVRAEHPLFAEARRFFAAAGFALSDVRDDPLAFLCRPASPIWEQDFKLPIYTRLFFDQPLTLDDVTTLHRVAEAALKQTPVLFAVVDQTPSDAGWIGIGALKAGSDVQIVPIDDTIIKRGQELTRERQTLRAHLQRFLGRPYDFYNVRDPVTDRLSFFGRQARAVELLQVLREGRPLALLGLRKMGKSSLVKYLRDHVPFPVAYVDLQSGTELPALYGRILNSWQESMRVKVADVAWQPPALSERDPSAAFTSIVHELLRRLEHDGHEPRLGLFVDEIELIMPPKRNGHLDPEALATYLAFARALRGLVQETEALSLLVVGVDPIMNRENRLAEQQNPLYQFFRETYLEPLSLDDCKLMVRNMGGQMGLAYEDAAVEFIAQVSGGHPFLARLLCSTAYQAGGREISGNMTLTQLQEAAALFVRDPNTAAILDERGLWGEVTNPALWEPPQIRENEAVLTSLAQAEQQSEAALLDASPARQVREGSLFELEQRAVLGRLEALLHIQFGLFHNWIRRYKT